MDKPNKEKIEEQNKLIQIYKKSVLVATLYWLAPFIILLFNDYFELPGIVYYSLMIAFFAGFGVQTSRLGKLVRLKQDAVVMQYEYEKNN